MSSQLTRFLATCASLADSSPKDGDGMHGIAYVGTHQLRRAVELLEEAEKFITGVAGDGSIARARKAQQWLARYQQ